MARRCGICGEPVEDHELQPVSAADARTLAALAPAMHPAQARALLVGGSVGRYTPRLSGRVARNTAPARVCPLEPVEVDGHTVWRRRSAPDAAA